MAALSLFPGPLPHPLQALFSGSIISVISVYTIIILLGVFDERATVQP